MEEITDKILLELGFEQKGTSPHSDFCKDGFNIVHINAGEQFQNFFYYIIKYNKMIKIKYINELKEEYLKHTDKPLS